VPEQQLRLGNCRFTLDPNVIFLMNDRFNLGGGDQNVYTSGKNSHGTLCRVATPGNTGS
jgi:hypothetical protein